MNTGSNTGSRRASANSSDNSGKSQNSLQNINGWLKDINPNYKSPFLPQRSNPYRINCGSCAFAVDARLNGNSNAMAGATNIGADREMEEATGKKCRYMPINEIEKHLINKGAGSHLIIGINRKPTPWGQGQSGHWFNAFYDGEKIHTIDGQTGEIYDWPYDYGDISEWCVLI